MCFPLTRCLPLRSLLATAIYLSILALAVIWLFRLSFREIGVTSLKVKMAMAASWQRRCRCPHWGNQLCLSKSQPSPSGNYPVPGFVTWLGRRSGLPRDCLYVALRGYVTASGDSSAVARITISAITFGLVHALSHDNAGWKSAGIPFCSALPLGIWCGLLRWRTSNVLVPAITHNIGNCAGLWTGSL
jgi:membrane protease YdiL (CAAX protease family)